MKGSENLYYLSSEISLPEDLEQRQNPFPKKDSIKEVLLRKDSRYFKRIDNERFGEPFHISSEISLSEDLEQRQQRQTMKSIPGKAFHLNNKFAFQL